jgi:manganese/iron transport system permease protein
MGVFSSIAGVYISYYHNLPSGPAIVLVSSTLFILALFLSPSQGILTSPEAAISLNHLLGRIGISNRNE